MMDNIIMMYGNEKSENCKVKLTVAVQKEGKSDKNILGNLQMRPPNDA